MFLLCVLPFQWGLSMLGRFRSEVAKLRDTDVVIMTRPDLFFKPKGAQLVIDMVSDRSVVFVCS
jgi:hypothetical protein